MTKSDSTTADGGVILDYSHRLGPVAVFILQEICLIADELGIRYGETAETGNGTTIIGSTVILENGIFDYRQSEKTAKM